MAIKYGEFGREAVSLAKKNWPGGLTLVVPGKEKLNKSIQGKAGNVGLRVPNNRLALELIGLLGSGIVTGSANFSGEKTPEKFSQINKELLKRVDLYFSPSDKGNTEWEAGGELPSTLVDTTRRPIKILRQGSVKIRI
jgi:L-threonylcarbamoyladenylate synthase